MEQTGEKSQDATPHRRQQAREEGQVAQSQDLAAALILVVGLLVLIAVGGGIADFFAHLAQRQLGGDAWLSTNIDKMASESHGLALETGKALLPLLGAVWLAAIVAHIVQFGFIFAPGQVAFDLMRLDPLAGFRRMFSISNVVKLGFGLVKILIVGAVAFWALYSHRNEIVAAAALELPQLAAFSVSLVLWTSLKIAGALLILALLDYGYQRYKFEQDLRMTPQEMREEMRNMQGDPQVTARRRAVQRQLVLNRLSQTVPKADVIVTNPTELAVAIQYDASTMKAPVVVAKGAGLLAQRIRRLGLESSIPIVERKPLAQALYRDVEVNHPVPDSMYAAVAEVLAYVYHLKGKSIAPPDVRDEPRS
jgi:flagellar biosynthetic protein FlhB